MCVLSLKVTIRKQSGYLLNSPHIFVEIYEHILHNEFDLNTPVPMYTKYCPGIQKSDSFVLYYHLTHSSLKTLSFVYLRHPKRQETSFQLIFSLRVSELPLQSSPLAFHLFGHRYATYGQEHWSTTSDRIGTGKDLGNSLV